MRNRCSISVVIPALNEEGAIANVLRDIPEWVDEVIVADNGSSDETVAIAEKLGAIVVHEPQRGYGAACLRGISALNCPDIVVFLDGDYSDHPEQMDTLVDPIIGDESDMVIGSRALGTDEPGALTPQARFGNMLACFLMRQFWGVRYTDLGPFRAIRYSSLLALNMVDTDYGWTVEMQIKATLHGLRATEVPAHYRKRIGRSKVSGTVRGVIGAGYKILSTIFLSAAKYHFVQKKVFSVQRSLIVFTRYPEPGKTKTRLIPALGEEGAAALQRNMTEHAVRTASGVPNLNIEIHYTGAPKERMIDWLGDQHQYKEQHPGNLGDRMYEALDVAFNNGMQHACIIVIDCPAITGTILRGAFDSLHKKAVTVGPATDGGYYLIGARSTVPRHLLSGLFSDDMKWGTELVYPETERRLDEARVPWQRLAYLNDLDRPEDLGEWEKVQQDFVKPDLTIIIPTLNECGNLGNTIESVGIHSSVKVLVADGGSSDGTCELAETMGATVISAPRGRAAQMNCAVAHAASDRLLFLHADTLLPDSYRADIESTLAKPNTACGAFRFQTNDTSPKMKIISFFANVRARWLGLPYGDQGLFMTRSNFYRANGYRDIPIMEDYALIRALRRFGRIRLTDSCVTTCARRWRHYGPWKTVVKNQSTILGYYLGRNQSRAAQNYNEHRDT